MKSDKGPDYIVLSLLFLAALLTRILPWDHVFVSGSVYFYDADCYIRLRKIFVYLESFPSPSVHDYFEGFPKGTGVIAPPAIEYTLAALLYPFQGAPSLPWVLERAAALLPPLIGGTTVLALYVFVRHHFGRFPAFVSALFLAVMPPHVEATVLGRFDNEMVEPLLLILAYSTYIRTYGDDANRKTWVAAGIISALFLVFWRGALFPLAIISLDLLYRLAFPSSREKTPEHLCRGAAAMYGVLAGIVGAITVADVWGTRGLFSYAVISWFHVVLFGVLFFFFTGIRQAALKGGSQKRIRRLLAAIAVVLVLFGIIALATGMLKGMNPFSRANPWLNSIQEYQPLIQKGGSVTYLLSLFGLFTFISPLFLVLFRSTHFSGTKAKSFFIIWTVIMYFAFFSRQRFALYYAINAAVIAGTVFFYVLKKGETQGFNRRRILISSSLIVLVLMQLPTLPYMVNAFHRGVGISIRGDLEEALIWMRNSTPGPGNPFSPQIKPAYGVLARWDYGGWIEYVARRPVVATNFGTETYGMEEAARFFLSSDESQMRAVLDRNEIRYLIIDSLVAELSMYAALLGEERRFFAETWSRELNKTLHLPTKEYYSLVSSRLFYADGSLATAGPVVFHPVEGVRLVHETGRRANIHGFPYEIKKLKVFEYLKGAAVLVRGVKGRVLTLSQTIETNQGRRFIYNNKKILEEDRAAAFSLLYPQKTHPLTVGAVGPVVLSDGIKTVELSVSSADIENGRVFSLSFP